MRRCAASGWNATNGWTVHFDWDAYCGLKVPSARVAIATIVSLVVCALPLAAQTSSGFETMTHSEEPAEICAAPRPPRDLHSFAYVRNGYREVLRIIAAERAIETHYCGCQFDLVNWEDAVLAIDQFQTSDNPKLPFDVIALRQQADAAEITLKEVCAE